MPSFAEMVGAAALFLPFAGFGTAAPAPDASTGSNVGEISIAPEVALAGETPQPREEAQYPVSGQPAPLGSLKVTVNQSQVRIESRVYMRIAPRSVSARRNLLAQLPVRARPQRYQEKKAEKCVKADQIAGVETGSGNRLLLFLRDADILSVNLEKACRARDFYAGFYVERNEDGQLCVERDTLQSRNGARCNIARMMQLEAVED